MVSEELKFKDPEIYEAIRKEIEREKNMKRWEQK
jgi:hypothetical protein